MFKDMTKELKLNVDKVIVISDVHIPFQNDDMINTVITYAKNNNINTLICAGDFLDCFTISPFIKRDYMELTFEDELKEANKVFTKLLESFNMMYFIMGNHEYFWLRRLEGVIGLSELFKLFTDGAIEGQNYVVSDYDHLYLNNSWYICHPFTYSRVPLSLPKRICSKINLNISCGHVHRLSIGRDESAKYYIVESGGLFDNNKLGYLKGTSTYPNQYGGFLSIINNKPSVMFL